MNIGIVTLHNDWYKDLANFTYDKNLVKYAKKHSYKLVCKKDNFSTEYLIYFEKIKIILDTFKNNPELDWAWWIDCDAMVTNFNTTLESIIDNDYHIIMSTDDNGLNCGSFLIRNTPQGISWLEMIFSQRFVHRYYTHPWPEQIVMMETARNYTDILKIIPQKTFNSYYYPLYGEVAARTWCDRLGLSGNWTPGDFVIHWPGKPNIERIELAKHFLLLQDHLASMGFDYGVIE
jgi:hypothetical protein